MYYSHHNIHEALGNVVYQTRIFVKGIKYWDDSEGSLTAYGNFEFEENYANACTVEEMIDEIHEELRLRCGCEWDCCGHIFGYGYDVKQIGKRTFSFKAYYSHNY